MSFVRKRDRPLVSSERSLAHTLEEPSMKAKKNIPKKREQPKPLPAPIDEQGQERLLPYEKSNNYLAEARLRAEDVSGSAHMDAINWLHHRASSLCDIVSEAAYSESGSEMPQESLSVVMGTIQEDIQVAKVLANKMYHLLQDRRPSPSGGAV